MNSKTLALFLIGNRDAILRVASCPSAFWIGLLFVFAAGIAREYDGEDLLHEPWHLLIPLAASLVSSAVLFLLVRWIACIHGAMQPDIVSGYRVFLTLYWMTAPLALLYGLPVERWLTAGDAAQANLWLLALVACWRVLLMARIIAVIFTAPFGSALAIVLFFADSLLLVALYFMPVPVLMIMGGVRLSPAESVIQGTSFLATALGIMSWPVWLITLLVVALHRQNWQYVPVSSPDNKISTDLWSMAILALCIFIPVIPFTQREQRLRYAVEAKLRGGDISAALELMSKHTYQDFPPHWDPPPRISYRRPAPDINDTLEHVTTSTVAPWVLDLYAEKYANWLHSRYFAYDMDPSMLDRQLAIIEKLPNRQSILKDQQHSLIYALNNAPQPLQARLQQMLTEAGIPIDQNRGTKTPAPEPQPDP